MTDRRVPDDFPRESDLASVTGVQPKLLVREADGRFQNGVSEEQLWVRYGRVRGPRQSAIRVRIAKD